MGSAELMRISPRLKGGNEFHGVGGPQKVSELRLRRPIAEYFIQAANEIGIPFNQDYNGALQEGVSYFQQTASKGFRWSTAKGFLRPARRRNNLKILTNAQVTRLLMDGRRVTGLEYSRGGDIHSVNAAAEVILSAGAINTPQLYSRPVTRRPSINSRVTCAVAMNFMALVARKRCRI